MPDTYNDGAKRAEGDVHSVTKIVEMHNDRLRVLLNSTRIQADRIYGSQPSAAGLAPGPAPMPDGELFILRSELADQSALLDALCDEFSRLADL